MGKRKAQVYHARKRLLERYMLSLSKREVEEMSEMIRRSDLPQFKDKVRFFDRQSLRVTRWFIWHEERWLPVVYDAMRKTVVTVLPAEALQPVPAPPPRKEEKAEQEEPFAHLVGMVGKHVLVCLRDGSGILRQFNGTVREVTGPKILVHSIVELTDCGIRVPSKTNKQIDTTSPSFVSMREV